MKKFIGISESEYEVMEAIWNKGDWIDTKEVHKVLSMVRKWAYNTVGTFLVRLCDKGLLKAEKRGRTNFYFPIISKNEYLAEETQEFVKAVHKGSKKSLIAALYKDELSESEIDELINWVEKR